MSDRAISRMQSFASKAKDALFLSSLIVAFCSAAFSVGMKILWPMFIEQLRTDLDMATREDLLVVQQQLSKVNGDDRIIRMPSGHSYVAEPVTKGEPIEVNFVMARTERGLPCNFITGTPLYTDIRGIPFAGEPIAPIKQLSGKMDRLQLMLDVPPSVQPGRVGLTISMKFTCPFGPNGSFVEEFDETVTLFFQMDPIIP